MFPSLVVLHNISHKNIVLKSDLLLVSLIEMFYTMPFLTKLMQIAYNIMYVHVQHVSDGSISYMYMLDHFHTIPCMYMLS